VRVSGGWFGTTHGQTVASTGQQHGVLPQQPMTAKTVLARDACSTTGAETART
jgi:hypothetical protein